MKKVFVIVTFIMLNICLAFAQDCYTGWTMSFPDAGKGVYKSNVNDMNTYRSVCNTTYVPVNGSAIINGKIRGIYHYMNGMIFHIIIDPETGVCDYGEVVQDGYSMCALCTAQDQTTGEVWGQFYNDKGTTDFGKVDYTTWTRTTIKSGMYHIYSVMGVGSDGYVYGITTDNKLYQIDKEDGYELYIGKTGITPNTNLPQAGEIYQKTNTFYYVVYDKNTQQNALFTVNLSTGVATKAGNAPSGLSFLLFLPQETEDKAPAAATDFAVSFEGASLSGEASFTAPTKAFDGSALSTTEDLTYIITIDSVEARRGTCKAGESKKVNITCVGSKKHEFRLQFENKAGLGDKAVINQWAGYDIPAAVKINLVMDDGNAVHYEWNEVSPVGKNGGVVNTDDVNYALYATDGESLKLLLYDGKERKFDFPCETGTDVQDYMQVALVVSNDAGVSDMSLAGIVVGEPIGVPYEEHFTGLDGFTHLVIPVTNNWYIDQDYYTDADGQSVCWMTNAPSQGELTMGKISLKDTTNPKYAINYRITPGDDLTITSALRLKSGELKTLETLNVASMPAGEAKWVTAEYDLKDYISEPYIVPEFFVSTNNNDPEHNVQVNFDNALIDDMLDYNLAISFEAPSTGVKGETANIVATVQNRGSKDVKAADYDVKLYIANELLHTWNGIDIEKYGMVTLDAFDAKLPIFANNRVVIKVVCDFSKDERIVDNEASSSMFLSEPVAEPVFAATYQQENDGIRLNWQAVDGTPKTITESFEGAAPWQYEMSQNISGFKVFTQDAGVFCKVFTNVEVGFEGMPGSFFVWNGDDYSDGTSAFNGRTGVQSLASVYKANRELTDFIESDNWVISPKLPGVAQTITLWGRNKNGQNLQPEQLEFYYSTSDDAPSSFLKVGEATLTSAKWEELSFDVPAGTKYFAVRQVSSFGFLLLIDDITYKTSTEAPVSFNVYRNEDFIANITDKTYYIPSAATTEKYDITAVYADGKESAAVTATDATAVNEVEIAKVNAKANAVFDVAGRRVDAGYRGVVISNGKKILNQ